MLMMRLLRALVVLASCLAWIAAQADDAMLLGTGGVIVAGPTNMIAPLMMFVPSPSDSSTTYWPLAANPSTAAAVPGNAGTVIAVAGRISNFSINTTLSTYTGSGWTFSVYRSTTTMAGSFSSIMSCTITNGNTSCSDTSNVTLAVGDILSIQSAPPASQASTANFAVSLLFTSNDTTAPLMVSGVGSNIVASTYYPIGNLANGNGSGNATEVNISDLIPAGATISGLIFVVKNAPGTAASGKSWTATLYHETAGNCASAGTGATSLAATILETAVKATDTSPGDGFTVGQNDCVSVYITSANTPANSGQWSIGVVWSPSTAGEYPLFESAASAPTTTANAVRYVAIPGQNNTAGWYTSDPATGASGTTPPQGGSYSYTTMTARDLSYLENTTVGGNGRSLTFRVANADQSPTVSVASGAVGGNSSNSYSVPASSLITVKTTQGSSNGNAQTWGKISFGIVTQ